MEIIELFGLLRDGESMTVEFKENLDEKEFKRTACAFANTKGGTILFGVKDDGTPVGVKDGKILQRISTESHFLRPLPECRVESVLISDLKIIAVVVKEASQLVSWDNRVFIRVGVTNYELSIDEVIEKSAESLRIFFDQMVSEVPASELNRELFQKYLDKRKETRGVEFDGDLIDTAVRMKILVRKDKGLFLTNGGILCFTSEPQKYISNSSLRITRFDDNEMRTYSFQKEFLGPLPTIVRNVEKYFVDSLGRVGGVTIGFKRQEYLEYPLLALREAIINAIIHRNYFDAADIRIFVFPDRVEIKNPGSFPPGVSVDEPEHKPRNPLIAQFFYDLGLTERYGSGIKKIISEISRHPLNGVQFVVKPYNTAVIFQKIISKMNLDELNRKILDNLVVGPRGSGEIAKIIGLTRQATIDRLKSLRLLGFVHTEGEGPRSVYLLSKAS